MQLLVRDQLPLQTVANRCGVHRCTIYRWKRRWDVLNHHVQMDNPNRPTRVYSRMNHLLRCTWDIPTLVSVPRTSPHAIAEHIVRRVLEIRAKLKRCAEVIWCYATTKDGLSVSLSSVRRILKRNHCFDGSRKKRVRPDNPERPWVKAPGDLVQTDTVHHVNPKTGKKLYYYTVIDLYTRMTHTTVSTRLRQGLAVKAVVEARDKFGFAFNVVQSDNGPEYSRYFESKIKKEGMKVRHSRLGRPNDNAHIERFNRTLQAECIGHYWNRKQKLKAQQDRLTAYLVYYNDERVHLGIQLRTPSSMLQRS
ncbi:MAG: DDE-type integrase/transposase/recombinase [Candidatus Saccharimonadales bacterium]